MIHPSAIAESIVAPTLFRLEFLHRLDPNRTLREMNKMRLDGYKIVRYSTGMLDFLPAAIPYFIPLVMPLSV